MDRAAEAAGHDAELAALRGRIAAVEAILARPWPQGAPAPPTLAALERRGGTLPGLAPLWDAPPPRTADRSPGRTTKGARASPTRAGVPERYGAGAGRQFPPIRALASAADRRAAGAGRVALGRAPLPP